MYCFISFFYVNNSVLEMKKIVYLAILLNIYACSGGEFELFEDETDVLTKVVSMQSDVNSENGYLIVKNFQV